MVDAPSSFNKIDQLRILLRDKPLDILAINETFLDENIPTFQLNIDGYIFERYDRGSRHGGGVGLYIRDNIDYEVYKRDVITQQNIEALFIIVKRPNRTPIIIGTAYRPPNSTAEYYENMINVIENIMCDHDCVLMGDLNYNYDINESLSTNPIHYMSQLFGMSQLVTEPTRVTMTSSSLIDVIMTTSPECHTHTGVMKLTLNDHFMPFTIIDGSTSKSPSRFVTIRDYKRFNVNAFLEEIRKEFAIFQTYLSHSCNLDINDIWTNWKVTLEKVSSRHAPLKTIRVKSRNNPWMTK